MSVIQRIRDKGAWIVFAIIALALIAFILQDGVGRGGSAFSNSTNLGKVNGEKINRTDFEQKLALQEQMYGSQGAQRDQLIGTVWNQEVERVVLSQEYKKLGLEVTGKELSTILFGDNSPLRQEFTDPATGAFKVNEARQAFAQIKKSKNPEQLAMVNNVYIDPTVQQTLRNKYQVLLQKAAFIPKWMIEKQQADNNAISNISYVYVPFASVADSVAAVSDAEIAAYVKKHPKEFNKDEETRAITYVSFNAAPSNNDSVNTLNQVLGLRNDFAVTNDPQNFLNKAGTEVPYYNSYFSKSRMQQANKDSLTSIPVGKVYGPYLDGSNYVLAKMIGVKQWPDSATVRHILIATNDPRTQQIIKPDSTGKRLVDSIAAAIKNGADFNSLVLKYSDDPGSKAKGGVYEYFPQGQMVVPFNDFVFDGSVGSKGVVKTDYGYHYVEVLGQKNVNPVYKIAYLAKPIVSSNETVSAANTAAAQFAATSKNQKEFNDNAAKGNLQLFSANDVKENDFSVNGLGQSRQMVRWIYENKPGTISEPTEIGDRYVVAIVTAINKPGLLSPAEARPIAEGLVRNEKKAKLLLDTKFKGNTLEAIATSTGTMVSKADSISFAAPFIPAVGNEPKVIGAAFNKAVLGKMSEPIVGSTGVFAIKVENIGAKPGSMDAEVIRQNLLQGARVAVFRGLEALKKSATIKDNRSKFY